MIFEKYQTIVFIGDSITDAGRRTANPPFGTGYMSIIQAMVTARYPDLDVTWHNRGVGGDTIRHLDARWQEDVIELNPDWLSVKIGINDVWRQYSVDEAKRKEAVPVDEFEERYRRLLQHAVDRTGCNLIIAEPYVIEKDQAESQYVQTREMAEVARKLAADFGAIFIATQTAFDDVLEHTETTDWAADRIHPNLAGHAVIAQAFLRALDFSL